MNSLLKRSARIVIFACAGLALFISGAQAKNTSKPPVAKYTLDELQNANPSPTPEVVMPQTQGGPVVIYREDTGELEVAQYTLDELQNVEPLPLPEVVMPQGAAVIPQSQMLPADALPGYAPAWDPQSGLPQPDPRVTYTIAEENPPDQLASGGFEWQTFGLAPTNPLSGPYAPFQRWTYYGSYAAQDTQVIGRL